MSDVTPRFDQWHYYKCILSHLRKKFLSSSLFFFTPLFLPQCGKLKRTRSNSRPRSAGHSSSRVQSTSNSTLPPEEHASEKKGGHEEAVAGSLWSARTHTHLTPWCCWCCWLLLQRAAPPPDAADKWPWLSPSRKGRRRRRNSPLRLTVSSLNATWSTPTWSPKTFPQTYISQKAQLNSVPLLKREPKVPRSLF